MMVVQAAGVLLLAFGISFPAHPEHDVVLKTVAGVIGLILLASLAVLRDRTPVWLLWAELMVFIVTTAALINVSPTDAGGVSLMLGMVTAAVYAGFWGDRRMSVAIVLLIIASGAVAIFANDRFTPALGSAGMMAAALTAGLVFVLQLLVSALEQQALIDPLTGVMNRRGLQALTQIRQASGRSSRSRSIAVIDIDDFKLINDQYGHAEGDRILRQLTEEWVSDLRSDDIVVRLGGDEFVIVLAHTAVADSDALIERLREKSATPWSYGVAEWPEGTDFAERLALADSQLLEKKRARGVTSR